jgi:undecaprenyl-diphosphatase
MSHLTFAEAGVVGLLQGITELFPVSSLGHAVLIPAIIGGQWAQDLDVSKAESPYLAYIVGLHVATALAMIVFFWRDWIRIIGAFFASLRHVLAPEPGTRRFEPQGTDQTLAWMIIVATIPVGIAGLLLEHTFRTVFSKPILTSSFLFVNGLILLGGEARRRRGAAAESLQVAADQQLLAQRQTAAVAAGGRGAIGGGGRHSSGQRALKQEQAGLAVAADRRLTGLGFLTAFLLGAVQILALLPGISRDGMVMVSGMFRGLSRQDAARFSFLLSAPVIFAAGALKVKDLTGPLGDGIRGQVLFGSVLSFIGAFLALRFLVSYLSKSSRTLTPFAIYCLAAGLGCFVYLAVK